MLKRRILVIGVWVAVVAIGALVVVLFNREDEPEYQGKRLSAWVVGVSPYPRPDSSEPSVEAVRAMGPVTVPYLVKWVSYRPATWKGKLPPAIKTVILRFNPGWDMAEKAKAAKAQHAMYALMALGPRAEPAVEALSKLLTDKNPPAHARSAPMTLARIGKSGLPPLVAAVTNQQSTPVLRCVLANSIGTLGTNARPAVPGLVQCLRNTNSDVVMNAAAILGQLKLEPDLVVPALVVLLGDRRYEVRGRAAYALGGFGEMARPAVPDLLALLQDKYLFLYPLPDDTGLRTAVTNVLLQIDPEALGEKQKLGKQKAEIQIKR